ncbi:MAG: nucleotidyltransferase family protein [Actinobacteria bacterium]|nr:nucleotidyltransferase family protein [Actinomycetota bacterium]MBU1943293.1 nucleotidyltransferase family protein [Actinomycetota bacterium]MBU2686589.1 nucleotidyltransferase family protein [Actinomycetota bacterium]
MTSKELLETKKDEIRAIADRHGVRRLRVFGSVARGEADPDSDVDFLVLFEEGRSLLDQASLLVDLQDLLGVEVDVVSEGGINPRMRDRILSEAVPL